MEKNTVTVTVREGNTELPDGSLVVFGYDVSGRVTSEEEAVSGVTFILFGVRIGSLLSSFRDSSKLNVVSRVINGIRTVY